MTERLAVFDCDGTLVDGQADICAAMDIAFAEAGLGVADHHAVRRIVGLSLPMAIRKLAPDASEQQWNHAADAYKQAYRAARMEGRIAEPLFDGIAPLINQLHGAGWLLGVATGKSDRGLEACLTAHGLIDRFCTLQTADRHPSKPHPAMLEAALADAMALPEHSAMIGDTSYDMAMARAAGVKAIGVGWGYHSAEELMDAGAHCVAASPPELEALLK